MSVFTKEVRKRFAALKEKKNSSLHVPLCPDMPDGMFPRLIGFISHQNLEKEPVENVWKGGGVIKKTWKVLHKPSVSYFQSGQVVFFAASSAR